MDKMRAIRAVEDLNRPGHRALVFASKDGTVIEEVEFPNDRISIIYRGDVYDWFGQKVELGEGIVSVVEPHGFRTNGDDKYFEHEDFIVELSTGRFSIAEVSYIDEDSFRAFNDSGLAYNREVVASQARLFKRPILKRSELNKWDFAYKDGEILRGTCFEPFFGRRALPQVFFDCALGLGQGRHLTMLKWPGHGHDDGCIRNYVVPSRKHAFLYYVDQYGWICGVDSYAGWAKYLSGSLNFSHDRQKVSTRFVFPNNDGVTRITTDAEVLEHFRGAKSIVWYYDP